MEFKDRLKELRESQQLTQKELGAILGVSRATISGYESKGTQPDHQKLIALSQCLNTSIDFLLTGTNPTIDFMLTTQQIDRKVNFLYPKLSHTSKNAVLEYIRILYQNDFSN